MIIKRLNLILATTCLLLPAGMLLHAASGTEGAAFLDIPTGAGPAAMGGAYSALAKNAYAPTWNPAGLGFLDSTQLAGQHLSYLDSIQYEYLSFVHPLDHSTSCSTANLCPGSALGGSIQYLGSGDINGMSNSGDPTGTFSSHYAAYNLAYGRAFTDKLSLGATGKLINAKIDDVSANAYAMDLGSMYRMQDNLMLAATLTNIGTQLKFLSDGDPLPLAFHVGGAYQATHQLLISAEGVYPRTGLASFHVGSEWRPMEMLALRMGYKTDTLKGLSPLAGFTLGLGLDVWGQELSYAWAPMGELGNTNYISLIVRFGEAEKSKRNLIYYQTIKKQRTVKRSSDKDKTDDDYQQLMQLFSVDNSHLAQSDFHTEDR